MLLGLPVFAQNLIPNASFEKMAKGFDKKNKKSFELANHWFSANQASHNLIKNGSNLLVNQITKSGNNYVGIVLYDASNSNFRSYVEVKMNRSLRVDEELCFWISVSAAKHSSFFTDELGIALTKDSIKSKNSKNIEIIPQLKSRKYQAIADTSEQWKKLEFHYKAKGGEQFLCIGNFRNDAQTLLLPNNSIHFPRQAYLYIDDLYLGNCDLSIEEFNAEAVVVNHPNSEILPQGKMHVPNVLTPNKDGFNDSFFIEGLPRYSKLIIRNKKDKEVYKSENYRNDWDGGDLPAGTYQFELLLPDGNRIDGPLDIVRKKK
jgi:hypothetical protein